MSCGVVGDCAELALRRRTGGRGPRKVKGEGGGQGGRGKDKEEGERTRRKGGRSSLFFVTRGHFLSTIAIVLGGKQYAKHLAIDRFSASKACLRGVR